ncbi:hypothetical protein F2Q68_00041151 [Brassica cretica]|uniref:Uncharacterized protein n=3 Tax=Brassica TaxID=3705 RepID=A0A8S9MMR6_BRACR|nr:hypothetical protein F2Q68_00041151 [Brassica cretica]
MADWGPVVIAVILFVLLTPGLLFQIPARGRIVEFGNMQTSGASILVHSIIFFGLITIFTIAIRLHIYTAETLIDRYVTVGAYSLLRSCTIEPECIIGQHSILMEGSLVETRSILEAGSVVPPGRRIPSGELWGGNPARFIRTLTNEETLEIPKLAVAINHLSGDYFSEFLPYSTVYLEVEKFKKSLGIAV